MGDVSQPTAGMSIRPTIRLIGPLGSGGMGWVWLAEHLALKTQVVVKFLAAELVEDTASRARFAREAAAAAQVKSPHVVQMLDHGVTDEGLPFIVMEHLEGHDLKQELRKNVLAPTQVASIVEQVARALERAHARGIIHRDVKPGNIFLCDVGGHEPFVKLLDFGIAKSGEPNTTVTSTGELVGTPVYMSPEQLRGTELDHRTDLWSLGMAAFHAFTGRLPFDGDLAVNVALKILNDPLPVPSTVRSALGPDIDAWFAKACARDPADRFDSARQLADALWVALGKAPPSFSGARTGAQLIPSWPPADENAPTATGGALASSLTNVPVRPRRASRWFLAISGLCLAGVALVYAASPRPSASRAAAGFPSIEAPRAPSASVATAPTASASSPASSSALRRTPQRLAPPRPAPASDPDDLGF